jgi:hypothetical protein
MVIHNTSRVSIVVVGVLMAYIAFSTQACTGDSNSEGARIIGVYDLVSVELDDGLVIDGNYMKVFVGLDEHKIEIKRNNVIIITFDGTVTETTYQLDGDTITTDEAIDGVGVTLTIAIQDDTLAYSYSEYGDDMTLYFKKQ